MKINEIIRERRLSKGLTQEQIANYLGVTAPAVNKWEKGSSYPDIVLLPALARLLDTDLNTLLSFQDNLSEKEVALFINEVSEIMNQRGFEAGYFRAVEKLKEYPTCDLLVIHLALLLDGRLIFNNEKKQNTLREKYEKEIEALYQRSAQSNDPAIREQAQACLISKWMAKQDYEKAQEILDTFPKKSAVDRKQIQANIWIAQGKLEEAAKLTEEKLLSATTEIQGALITLMEIAIKEKRMDDAEYIAEVDKQSAQLFDLWEYNSYVAQFELYTFMKNKMKSLKILLPMLKSLTKKWNPNQSPLYRHIQTKEVDKTFGETMRKTIIESIHTEKDTEFLKDSPELQALIKEMGYRD
ncbi:MAG: helix-turn-helix transcriptional regulator [Clostridiales bacterium]|nr:helix-turn-helix transcriptional regulator [Clostridiales bacterium]